ncbi:MAG: hypothetical protein WAQ98_00015 [Blastocatellia bacterium]
MRTNNSKNLKTKVKSNGFTVMELAIASLLVIIVMAVLFSMTTTGITNGRFVEKLSDASNLLTKKVADVYKNASIEVGKLKSNETQLGSIDPTNPIPGYFDILNASGCVLATSTVKPNDEPIKEPIKEPTKGAKNLQRGKGFEPVDDIDKEPIEPQLIDCSGATVINPSKSLIPMFRRQWMIVKDKPLRGDITVAAVIITIDKNTVLRSEVLTKIDGAN